MALSKSIFAIIILAAFAIAATGSIHMTMTTDAHGNMAPCPLMNGSGSSACPMNIAQHITAWQSLFNTTMPNAPTLLLAIILLLVGFSLKSVQDASSAKEEPLGIKLQNFISLSFSPLRLAFSRGILHSKRYNFITIS